MRTTSDLRHALADVAAALAPVAAASGEAGSLAREVVTSIETYALPRLDHPSAPLVVAVSGLTGVGKSALVNAVTGSHVSAVGLLRPTTTEPIVVVWPTPGDGGRPAVTLVDLPPGPSLAAAPHADVHLFVTSPARYADAEGWDHLGRLVTMAVPTWVVLVGVGPEDGVVVSDLRRRLDEAGFDLPLFAVPDLAGGTDAVVDLRDRLAAEAADPAPLHGRLAALVEQAGRSGAALRRLAAVGDELLAAVDSAYGPAEAAAVELAGPGGAVREVPGAADRPWTEVVDRLALVLTHRIGTAAEAAASRWAAHPDGAGLLEGDGAALWRHRPDAAAAVRDHLLGWPGEVEELVVSRLRPRRWWQVPVPPAELAALVKRHALGGPPSATRRERRRLEGGLEGVSDEARGLLGRLALGVVDTDKRRFVERIPAVDPGVVVAVERAVDAASRALDSARVGHA